MSCEQAIFANYIPRYKPFDISKTNSLAQCSQKCCESNTEQKSCGIYTYSESNNDCYLYRLPDQPFYLPLPSMRDMVQMPGVNTGILMKRKIVTWIPILILIILFLIALFGIIKANGNKWARLRKARF